jgi:peptidoglycan/LPS O-acetylase OafA/YrhL
MVLIYLAGLAISELTLGWLEPRVTPSAPEGMDEAFVHYWLPYQLYRFFAGFSLYFLIRERIKADHHDPATAGKDLIRALALLGASFLIFGLSMIGRLPRFVSSPVCTLALVFFCWALSVFPLRLFVNAATRLIGRLSFSAYVSHFAAIIVVSWIFETLELMSGSLHWLIGVSAFLVACLGLTLAASEVLYRLVEKPGQSLGRRIIKNLAASTLPLLAKVQSS